MPPFFDQYGDPSMDPYTILSLPPTANETEIKKAYRMQMLQLHPDKLSPSLGDESIAAVTDKFHNVKDAYEFLISPLHLTARRLYMAKIAAQRADFERREAFLRRNGGKGDEYTAYNARGGMGGGVSGYRSGGGGAAGMAGSGMPARGNSYPFPPKSRTKTDADFGNDRHGKDPQAGSGQRRSGGGNGMYKNVADRGRTRSTHHHHQHASRRKNNKGKERNGYKSDTAGYKTKSNNMREGRSNKPRSKNNATKKENRQRGKSEPRHRRQRYESEAEKRTSNKENRKNRTDRRDATKDKSRERRRQRAKSAPARYSRNARNRHDKTANNSNGQDLPAHFFCPLTKRLMKDPVMDTEGNAYDREAIERWLRVQSSSPITNGYLSVDMLKPDRELKKAIYRATGKPRSKSQTRGKSRPTSPTEDLVSGRVLIDSYLREISSKSKLSVSLDGMGICAFSYRRVTFVIEVPMSAHAGFMVYSSFDGQISSRKLTEKMAAWNNWLSNIGRHSTVSYVKSGQKTVFTLKGGEVDMSKCDVFQKTLEYFVEMSLKLHNLLHPMKAKVVENVSLTRTPVEVV